MKTLIVRLACLALGSLCAIGCAAPRRMTCDVELAGAAEGLASVTCTAVNVPDGPIVIKQMAQDALVRVSDFTATTADGAQLPVESRQDLAMGSEARHFTERVVSAVDRHEVTYKYRVQPGAWTGDTVSGTYGRRFGFLDAEGGLLSGRNLFLLPSWYRSMGEIRVEFHLKPDWRLVGTLPQEHGVVRATGEGLAAAALIESVIGLGPYEDFTNAGPEARLRLCLHSSITPQLRETLWRAAHRGFELLKTRLGPLDHDFTIVLAPPPPDGSMILVPFSSSGLGSEIVSARPVQMYDLLYGMARVWTAPERTSFRFATEDMWLREAIPAYEAVAALEDLGIRSSRESWLMRSRSARQGLGSLTDSSPPAGAIDWLQSRRAKGSYLLALVDTLSRQRATAEPGDTTVIQATRDLRRREGRGGFFDAVSALSGGGAEPLREIAGSAGAIPAEWIGKATGVTPMKLTVSPQSPGRAGVEPGLKILVTAGTKGLLEVCGCVARQYGGIARRETVRRAVLRQEVPMLMVDLGNGFSSNPKNPMLDDVERRELGLSLDLLGQQDYAAAAIGHFEALRGARFFTEMTHGRRLPYVSANLRAGNRPLAPGAREVQSGALRIGFVSALDPGQYTGDHARFYEQHLHDLQVDDPITSLKTSTQDVRARTDLVIAIGGFSPSLVRRILEEVPAVDVILSTEGPDAAMDGVFAYETDGEARLMGFYQDRFVFFSTAEGRSVEEIAFGFDPRGRIRSARVTDHVLGEAVADAPEFRSRLAAFYDELKGDPIISGSEEPIARVLPSQLKASEYAGADNCRACHEDEWSDWRQTLHGSAFAVLLSRHRNYAPRCVGCHVTGYGHASGYKIGDPLEKLRHVQCEMCHGPGSGHAAAPSRMNIRREPPAAACFECHTPDHSRMSRENFADYYARTRHGSAQAKTLH